MKEHRPPKWATRFLRFYCKPNYLEQIEGDLYEVFERSPATWKGKLAFGWNTLRFLRWRYLKTLEDFDHLTIAAMILNYLKVGIRTLRKEKTFTCINVLGLALGITACLLIAMYIRNETNYDTFYSDIEKVYRVANGENGPYTPPLLAETIQREVSAANVATRIHGLHKTLISIEDRRFEQEGAAWGDQYVFEVFPTTFLYGNAQQALSEPDNVVLTESLAKKCFPSELAYQQTIQIDGNTFKVAAVVEDPPQNTHFPYQYIIASLEAGHQYWTGNSVWTYVKLEKNSELELAKSQLHELYATYAGPELLQWSGHASLDELKKAYPDQLFGYTLFPAKDIHLHKPRFSMAKEGNYDHVVMFSLIGLFILIIACINYINMSTARSAVRSKEVGVRKVMGAGRGKISMQFLVESFLITFLASLLATAFAWLLIPTFNQLTARTFETSHLFSASNLAALALLVLGVSTLAGSYPAYVISRFSPLVALRGQSQQKGKQLLRSGLVAFQFAISIFLIACTMAIYQQLTHLQSQELGIDAKQTLVIHNGMELANKYSVFKNELESLPETQVVAKASNVPFSFIGDWTYTIPEDDDRAIAPYNAFMSPNAKEALGIEMIKGRFFREGMATDSSRVVINETLAKEIGFANPIGQTLSRAGSDLKFTIIGVMKDFHFKSLKREIDPMIVRYGSDVQEIGMNHQQFILVRLSNENVFETIDRIESIWNKHVPHYPFDGLFLDDSFQRLYEGEHQFGQAFIVFSGLAVSIALLGLFALTTFVLRKRVKEIALRKVLGAPLLNLQKMMLKDFTYLVLLGGALGTITACYWLEHWLNDYSYRISIHWYLIASPILLMLLLTWSIVSFKSYKASTVNPAEVLKEE